MDNIESDIQTVRRIDARKFAVEIACRLGNVSSYEQLLVAAKAIENYVANGTQGNNAS